MHGKEATEGAEQLFGVGTIGSWPIPIRSTAARIFHSFPKRWKPFPVHPWRSVPMACSLNTLGTVSYAGWKSLGETGQGAWHRLITGEVVSRKGGARTDQCGVDAESSSTGVVPFLDWRLTALLRPHFTPSYTLILIIMGSLALLCFQVKVTWDELMTIIVQ